MKTKTSQFWFLFGYYLTEKQARAAMELFRAIFLTDDANGGIYFRLLTETPDARDGPIIFDESPRSDT